MNALKNKIGVITGASSGIGKAITLALAEKGVILHLLGRRLGELEKAAEIARKNSTKVQCWQVDLTKDYDVQKLIKDLQSTSTHIDLLIHSAGTLFYGLVKDAPVEDFDKQYLTNVRAPYVLTQGLIPMIGSCQGQIVFINSSAGLNAGANFSQYAATKHALKAIADSLRQEMNPQGVRVLSIFPGRTASPMQEAVFKAEEREYRPDRLMQPEDIASTVITSLCLSRSAEITDIHLRPLTKS